MHHRMPTLTRSQAGKAVSLNWLFLDQTRQLKLCRVNIPHHLFTDCVQDCQELFATELETRHNFKAKIHSITFFQVSLRVFFLSRFLIPSSPKNPFS